jgi:class 3 adenylate cyclase/predicted ATPase
VPLTFEEVVDQAIEMLQRRGQVTYRFLKRQFDLDEASLEDLKEEILYGNPQVVDDDRGLVWNGDTDRISAQIQLSEPSQPPSSYTPQHLAERIRAEQAAMESRGATEGERKTITALFSDLKGSTALTEGLDPEDARAIIDPALHVMMDAVHRYDGYVAQALGDGIFALFGAPIAHEDHPQRALYAALRMQKDMRRYSDQLRLKGGTPLQLRVGVNTGEVVVRSIHKDDLHADYVPVGHSTNLAARMEQMATPGSIVISEYTRKLTEGYFELQALGAADIKGMGEPLNVYEVIGAGPLRTKLQIAARRGLTRFVGRHSEMEHMRRAFEQAKAGHGQIVGVMGEPGLGKSRLCFEFKLTSQSGCLVLEAFSVSYGKTSPYWPVIELLKTYFQIQPQDDERTRKEKVTGKVLTLERGLEDTLPYLFALLGIDDPASRLQQIDTEIRRHRTFEALKKLFLRESLNQPLILVFEDLHWIDTETQGFLGALSESVASARLLLLMNYRPEYRHEWGQKSYYSQLHLTPLGKNEAAELLASLLGDAASLQDLPQLILERTEGTPFFMEEVVQTLAEEGVLVGEPGHYQLDQTSVEMQIPPTVQGVLAARIDRLTAEEKELLQQLSVIGRELPLGLVLEVISQSEADLYRVLSALQNKEFLYERPTLREVEYIFKHALTQEVAYGTVLQDRRKALHERTGQVIEDLYPASLEDHYGELAHHYGRSDNTEKAIEYLHLAGQQAVQRSATEDAMRYLTYALELLNTLPDTPGRVLQELKVQTQLGSAVMAAKGFVTSELEAVYARIRELCRQVDDPTTLFPALWGVWLFYGQLDLTTARELSAELLILAQRVDDPAFLIEAHHASWTTSFWFGDFSIARDHAEQAMALYIHEHHQHLTFLYGGHNPGVCCRDFGALALWLLGYPDRALKSSQEAVAMARELAHPFSLAEALGYASWLSQFRREVQAVSEYAEVVGVLSTEEGLPYWQEQGLVLQGWALGMLGQSEEGIVQIRSGIDAMWAMSKKWQVPYYLTLLAEVYVKSEQVSEGLSALAEGLEVLDTRGVNFYTAELHRLKGELLLIQAHQEVEDKEKTAQVEAEGCFRQALEVACRQQAKSFELRAAMSLSRLWQKQGKKEEARRLLSEIYGWFTEGFDTADLQEAKALLEELS